MIAIKDAKWKVSIIEYSDEPKYWWELKTEDNVGLLENPCQLGVCGTISSCKRNWLRFAKLNKIPKKNWRYVCPK